MTIMPRCAHIMWRHTEIDAPTSWTCACWGGPDVSAHLAPFELHLLDRAYRTGQTVTYMDRTTEITVTPFPVGRSCRKDRSRDWEEMFA